jgi:hypothetical protein
LAEAFASPVAIVKTSICPIVALTPALADDEKSAQAMAPGWFEVWLYVEQLTADEIVAASHSADAKPKKIPQPASKQIARDIGNPSFRQESTLGTGGYTG